MQLTAVFKQVPEGYIAFIEELPGANTQGDTLEEARENLKEAVALVLEANRILAEEELAGEEVVREIFTMPDAA
jgi:predicted RNase H-like HicB family nuclease